jgi:hypothetical protein
MTDTFNVDNAALDDIPLTCAAQPIELGAIETHWVFNAPLPIEVVSAVLEEMQGVCESQTQCHECPFSEGCLGELYLWDVPAAVAALQAHWEASHE